MSVLHQRLRRRQARVVARFLSCQPDAPDGRRWLVLALADVAVFPGAGPVLVAESSHERLADARLALEAANGAEPPPAERSSDA